MRHIQFSCQAHWESKWTGQWDIMTYRGKEDVCKLVQCLFLCACKIAFTSVCAYGIVCTLSIGVSVFMCVHVLAHVHYPPTTLPTHPNLLLSPAKSTAKQPCERVHMLCPVSILHPDNYCYIYHSKWEPWTGVIIGWSRGKEGEGGGGGDEKVRRVEREGERDWEWEKQKKGRQVL